MPLLDKRQQADRDESLEPVQLLEGAEYIYEFSLHDRVDEPIGTDRPEVFDADTRAGDRGRIRPGLYTGMLRVGVQCDGRRVGHVAFEIRSRKLGYLSDYRWMLRDIAEGMSELLMRRFAPTQQRFVIDESLDAPTLYQRFAFLKALLESDVFEGAIQQVVGRPYRTWLEEHEWRRPGRGAPTRSHVLRQLTRPGARTPAGALGATLGIDTLPQKLEVVRTEETLDNIPNRFVAFALRRWRDVVTQIHDLLRQDPAATAPVHRGIRESAEVIDRLDALLAHPVLRDVGMLDTFPASNQVLQKREGYRDVFRAYVQFEAAAKLVWRGGEDVYGAGQRDVATLYEYWVYCQLGEQVSGLCDEEFDFEQLLEESNDGLEIKLRRGESRILEGEVERLGRRLRVELWYNRTFRSQSADDQVESWTRSMRPDYSLRIHPAGSDRAFFHKEVWLHFDAKYRVNRVEEVVGEDDPAAPDQEPDNEASGGTAKRGDLDKMHAYRDAIYRSSGAYVIYPGDEERRDSRHQEVLPGLGAFGLRPSQDGKARGADRIRSFIDEVLSQVAHQASQHERAAYWTRESYELAEDRSSPASRAVPFLPRPPADTLVLLGWVKTSRHYDWIKSKGLYNLRADGRTGSVGLDSEEVAADLLLLYGSGCAELELWSIAGAPRLMSRDQMMRARYPNPRSSVYLCLQLAESLGAPTATHVGSPAIESLQASVTSGAGRGAPCVLTWKELVERLPVLEQDEVEGG